MVGVSACADGTPTGPDAAGQVGATAALVLSANVAGTTAVGLVVTVTAPDVPTPVVYNLTATNGTASGTIKVPPGVARTITVQAVDARGDVTHEGQRTMDVRTGLNPALAIPLVAKAGQVPVTATLVALRIAAAGADTMYVGGQVRFTATLTDAHGAPVAVPAGGLTWASSNPALATVDANGLVTAVAAGAVTIAVSHEGVSAVRSVHVDPRVVSNEILVFAFVDGRSRPFRHDLATGVSTEIPTPATIAGARFPTWAPDHRRIAYAELSIGTSQLFVANADGSGARAVAAHEVVYGSSWSPDGRRIAYVASPPGGGYELWVANSDGTDPRRLDAVTLPAGAYSVQTSLNWSPDSRRITFGRYVNGDAEVYVAAADGSGLTRLTTRAGMDGWPSFSPDGRKIAFCSDRVGGGAVGVYVMNADGSGVTLVTSSTGNDFGTTWSPDGQWILFNRRVPQTGAFQLWRARSDGSQESRIDTGAIVALQPQWW
jgi:TolB protein